MHSNAMLWPVFANASRHRGRCRRHSSWPARFLRRPDTHAGELAAACGQRHCQDHAGAADCPRTSSTSYSGRRTHSARRLHRVQGGIRARRGPVAGYRPPGRRGRVARLAPRSSAGQGRRGLRRNFLEVLDEPSCGMVRRGVEVPGSSKRCVAPGTTTSFVDRPNISCAARFRPDLLVGASDNEQGGRGHCTQDLLRPPDPDARHARPPHVRYRGCVRPCPEPPRPVLAPNSPFGRASSMASSSMKCSAAARRRVNSGCRNALAVGVLVRRQQVHQQSRDAVALQDFSDKTVAYAVPAAAAPVGKQHQALRRSRYDQVTFEQHAIGCNPQGPFGHHAGCIRGLQCSHHVLVLDWSEIPYAAQTKGPRMRGPPKASNPARIVQLAA